MTKINNEDRNNAIKELKKLIGSGKTIHTIVRHVSASGMQRRISCFVPVKNKRLGVIVHEIQCIDWYIEKLGSYKRHATKEGLIVNGCGMDMGFAVVYDVSSTLYKGKDRAGYELKQRWL